MKNIDINNIDFNKNKDGLVPVIIQNWATLKVLMLGFMNKEALTKSLDSKVVTFYSRSKKRLWTKGETSGNYLYIKDLYLDCDNDTILIMVEPKGNTCHKGTTSCFNTPDNEGFIRNLEKIIEQRIQDSPQNSYTAKIFNKGVNKMAQKVGEEAVETVIEAIADNRERFIYETSDLVYHLLILMRNKNVTLAEIENELISRHK